MYTSRFMLTLYHLLSTVIAGYSSRAPVAFLVYGLILDMKVLRVEAAAVVAEVGDVVGTATHKVEQLGDLVLGHTLCTLVLQDCEVVDVVL